VSGEIDTLRGELGNLVAELDRRRHEALDIGLQLRRHPVAVAVVATSAALLVGGAIALIVRTRHERRRPTARVREARRALGRLLEDPYHVAREPSMGTRILGAAATAAGAALARRVVNRVVHPAPSRG
jgi:hypothetical protein